jgi:hypothetical protein
MAQLSTKIKLYCEANSKTADFGPNGNVSLQDDSDGNGPYIKTWSVSGLAQPTTDQLATYETAGNTEETNHTVRATRKAAYGDIGDQLDEIFKDIDAWKARIQGIKDANPKS